MSVENGCGCVALVYPTFNRLDYTKQTLPELIRLTHWPLVHSFWIFDDSSVDGTWEWLNEQAVDIAARVQPAPFSLEQHSNSHVNAGFNTMCQRLCQYRDSAGHTVMPPYVAKIDNDILLHDPDWLQRMVHTLDAHPECACLGGWVLSRDATDVEDVIGECRVDEDGTGYVVPHHIGGNFVMRLRAMLEVGMVPMAASGSYARFQGSGHYQTALQRSGYKVAYAYPGILMEHLDEPDNPASRTAEYADKGWGRNWEAIHRENAEKKKVERGA